MDKYKTCFTCKQTKPVTEFGMHKDRKDGYDSYCLICRRIKRAEYRKQNAESIKRQQADNYQRNRTTRLKYAKDNARPYDAIMAERAKIWRSKNKALMAFHQRTRRAKMLANTIYAITNKDLKRLYNQSCIYCGSKNQIEIDHVIPIARGGVHGIGNLAAACKTCNRTKQAKFVMEWRINKLRK